jgi:drug/metabolite transporter (DMT)-like permease
MVSRARKRRILYATGIILNNLGFLWALLANMYAPTAYYTATFGFGLVVMMLFSEFVLREPISKLQHIGAVIIAVGTILIGGGRGNVAVPPMQEIVIERVGIFTIAYFLVLLILIGISLKYRYHKPIGIVFGLFTGGAAAFDPIFKGIGQQFGDKMKFIPHTLEGWLFFGGSFLFGFLAFSFTQLGFYKHARASTLVAFHNVALILVPIIFMKLALPGFGLSRYQLIGLVTVLGGIFLMFTEHTYFHVSKLFRKR